MNPSALERAAIEERLIVKAGKVLKTRGLLYNLKGKSEGVIKTGGWGYSSDDGRRQ
jgi:hypothetical protein